MKPYKMLSQTLQTIVLTWLLALTPQLAHADFRKALDAYIARDGDTLLKEVKDAVEKKNDDGLHIFIMQLRQQFMARGFLSDVEKAKEKSEHINIYSFSTLLTEKQSTELISLLNQAVQALPRNNDYYESRAAMLYLNFAGGQNLKQKQNGDELFAAWSKAWRDLANEVKGKLIDRQVIEIIAYTMFDACEPKADKRLACLILAAELGEPYAQSDLGQLYLGETDIEQYSFIRGRLKPLNLIEVDKKKAYYWLEQSVINSEFPTTTLAYCSIARRYQYGDETHAIDLKQAYLLYLWDHLGSGSYGYGAGCSKNGLVSMFKDGSLAKVAPEYMSLWESDNKLWAKQNKIAPPPTEVRKLELPSLKSSQKQKSDLVFSYTGYRGRVQIYAGGLAVFKKGYIVDKWQVPPDKLNQLLQEICGPKFLDLPIYQSSLWEYYNDHGRYELSCRAGEEPKTIHGDNHPFAYETTEAINKIIIDSYKSCNYEKTLCL